MKIIIWTTVGVVVIVMVVVGVIAMLGAKGDMSHGKGTKVRLHTVGTGDLVEFVTAPGEVAPRTKVAISARVSALIVAMPFEEGDTVTAGDPNAETPIEPSVLVSLDAAELTSSLRAVEARRAAQDAQRQVEIERIASQRARIDQTKASLAQANRDLSRQQELLASGDASQSVVDQAQSRVDELAAQLDSAEHDLAASQQSLVVSQYNLEGIDAEIARARDSLGHTKIVSPIDGVVTRVNAEVGELAMTGTMNNPGTVILEVADLSTMVVNAQIDEADVGGIKVGQPVKVHIHAYPDRVFKGTVSSVALAAAQGASRYFQTEILLDTEGDRIYCGLNADVDVEVARHQGVLTIPSQAVLGRPIEDLPTDIREDNPNVDETKTIVTVVYRCIDNKAVVTPVKIGASDATHTVIQSGLAEGDCVIIGPYKELEKIKHDQKVQDEKAAEKDKAAKDKADKDKTTEGKTENDENDGAEKSADPPSESGE